MNIAFFGVSISMFYLLYQDASIGAELTVNVNYFYWFSPNFVVIQTINHLLLPFSILSFLVGNIVTERQSKIMKNIKKSIKSIFFNLLISIITTLICELFVGMRIEKSDFNVILLSLTMFVYAMIFMVFWALLGYGLKLSFNSKFSSLIVGITYQIFEYIHINRFYPQFSKYLPLALSRELVVNQFPYWLNKSWLPGTNSVAYFANASFIRDKSVTIFWVFSFLIFYLLIAFIPAFISYVKNGNFRFRGDFLHVKRNFDKGH